MALDAARTLESEGAEVDVINMASIKPIDEDLIIESASNTGMVVTVEDHSVIGGLGGAVSELLSEKHPVKVIRLGVQDKFGASGTPAELVKAYGFDAGSIASAVRQNL